MPAQRTSATPQLFDQFVHSLPGFVVRPQQRKLAQQIEQLLAKVEEGALGPVLIAEAPTGVGKTLAYLVGALAAARAQGRKLLISTCTINLQAQILDKDIPLFCQAANQTLHVALAKGRERYVCPLHLEYSSEAATGDIFEESANVTYLHQGRQDPIRAQLTASLASGQWDGDRETWPHVVPDTLWNQLTCDRHACSGRRCPKYAQCPYYKQRAEVEQAEIIISNHSLVLADLNLGGGVVLPDPKTLLYVFDEAHRLPQVALDRAECRLHPGQALAEIERTDQVIRKLLLRYPVFIPPKPAWEQHLWRAMEILHEGLSAIDRLVRCNEEYLSGRVNTPLEKDRRLSLSEPFVREMVEVGKGLVRPSLWLERQMDTIRQQLIQLNQLGKINTFLLTRLLKVVGRASAVFQGLAHFWVQFGQDSKSDSPPFARWLSRDAASKVEEPEYLFHVSPSSAAEYLDFNLWQRCRGAVLVSATLRALGSFDRYAEDSGLTGRKRTYYRSFPSPFNYQTQGVLMVPWVSRTPTAGDEAYSVAIARILPSIIDPKEGTLVIFTSHEFMEGLFGRLPAALRRLVLRPGQGRSRQSLRDEHVHRVENGMGSILFGVDSFAEGLDLPGKLCTHVIITRLPFPNFTAARWATLADWMQWRGRNAFRSLSLPAASIRLIQSTGRLLRTESDQGRITILDRRIIQEKYGRELLEALPGYQREIVYQEPRLLSAVGD